MHVGHHVSSFVSSGIYTLEQKMSHNMTFDFNMINVYAPTYICPTMYVHTCTLYMQGYVVWNSMLKDSTRLNYLSNTAYCQTLVQVLKL